MAAFLLEFIGVAFAQTTSGGKCRRKRRCPVACLAHSRRASDLDLIVRLKRKERRRKPEQVKIENGKRHSALFTGDAVVGQRGSCSTVSNVPASYYLLTRGGMSTIIAKTVDCGTWEQTLQRALSMLFNRDTIGSNSEPRSCSTSNLVNSFAGPK